MPLLLIRGLRQVPYAWVYPANGDPTPNRRVFETLGVPSPLPGFVISISSRILKAALRVSDLHAAQETEEADAQGMSEVERAEYRRFLSALDEALEYQELFEGLSQLWATASVDDLRSVVAAFPMLRTPVAREYDELRLRQSTPPEDDLPLIQARRRLLSDIIAGADPDTAWGSYQQDLTRFRNDVLLPRLTKTLQRLRELGFGDSSNEAVELRREAIPLAAEMGDVLLVAHLHAEQASALLDRSRFTDPDGLHEAIRLLKQAREIAAAALKAVPSADGANDVYYHATANLGSAIAHDERGDRGRNLEEARILLEEALTFYTKRQYPDRWAGSCSAVCGWLTGVSA